MADEDDLDGTGEDTGSGTPPEKESSEEAKGLLAGLMAERKAKQALREEKEALERRLAERERDGGRQEWTWAGLQEAVEKGHLTEAQAQEAWSAQRERRTVDEATRAAEKAVEQRQREQEREATIGRYIEAMPDVAVPGSETNRRVEREARVIAAELGESIESSRVQALALRAAFGAPEHLGRQAQRLPPPTHEEGGSGDGEGEQGGDRRDGWPKDMPARQRQHYAKLVERGQYRSQKDAVDEWKRYGRRAG